MSNRAKEENDPSETSQQHGSHEDRPGSDRQIEDNIQGSQAPAPGDPPKIDGLSPCQPETLRRFFKENLLPDKPRAFSSDIPCPPAPLPPVKPLDQKGSPLSSALARIAKVPVQDRQSGAARARAHLDKRRTELRHEMEVRQKGPQGEARSAVLTKRVENVRLDMIVDDPQFKNFRLDINEEGLRELAESMKREGLKVPVTVIEAPGEKPSFFVRAGFRRTMAALRLGWQTIPAIVLPKDTPLVEERWTNIIENSARHDFATYEIANAAKFMRDKHGINARDFAARAGYSEPHVSKLLRCIDVLPDEILSQWRAKARLPLDLLAHWTTLPPDEALAQFHLHSGQPTKPPMDLTLFPRKRTRNSRLRITTDYGFKRMGLLRSAILCAAELDEKTQRLCLQIVDFCMGAREAVIGIHDPTTRQRRNKARRQDEPEAPQPPDLDDTGEPTPPQTEDK